MVTEQNETVVRLPRREVAGMATYHLVLPVLGTLYLVALGAPAHRPVRFAILLALTLLSLVLSAIRTSVLLWGAPPALTVEGIRLRTSRFGVALTLLPWPQVQQLWPETYLGSTSLAVQPRGRGKAVWYVPLPARTTIAEIDAAIRTLSGGTVVMFDRAPDDGRSGQGRRRRRPPVHTIPAWRYPIAVLSTILVLPILLNLPEPWHQPWWPGN